MKNLHHISDDELFTLLKKSKDAALRYLDAGKAASEPFHIGIMMVEIFEREMRARGFDPTEERFGPDIIGEVIQAKVEANDNSRA